MFNYSHILYAVDLSDKDIDKSITKVMDAAKASHTKISIINYVQDIATMYAMYSVTMFDTKIKDSILKSARDKLVNLVKEYTLDESCIIVESSSNINVSLIEKAKELKVEAIYLNGHKHNIIGRLGSVADYVINKAECDVLILK
jgi:universal stress protein A